MTCLIGVFVLIPALLFGGGLYRIDPPGGLSVEEVPLFVSFGWDDNAYADGVEWVLDYTRDMRNYDGSAVRGTFFITTNFATPGGELNNQTPEGVKNAWLQAYAEGNEIANHTEAHERFVSNKGVDYWLEAIGNANSFIVNEMGIPHDSIMGFRTPFLEYGDGTMEALEKLGFRYDCSVECGFDYYSIRPGEQTDTGWVDYAYSPGRARGGKLHWWPYTMDAGVPEGTNYRASRGVEGMWQIPVNVYQKPPVDFTDFNAIPDDLEVSTVTGFDFNIWNSIDTREEVLQLLKFVFHQRLQGNRSPLTINVHSDYYSIHNTGVNDPDSRDYFTVPLEERKAVLEEFTEYITTFQEVRVVPYATLVDWLENPVPLSDYRAPNRFGLAENGETNSVRDMETQQPRIPHITVSGTELHLRVEESAAYGVDIFTPQGQLVHTVHRGVLDRGLQRFCLNNLDMGRGHYIIRVQGEETVRTLLFVQ
ncbi:polysaccharide deacetylase family protein [Chitinivibrio alkaliphilus]|uniref:Polysaccharide deacetylase n=1 Tax=Chitinivibrio alkaliphilus ACht1 TaxID=1313304 RepID=U7D2Z6_9BACT|nr:polysaccharide deacetylase family protein [Chitinivibrio alkaliphilus]ERP30854.1 polysaccharide deacetylase [Chitinivibrio alkaliphilus ACht1]